MKEGWEYKKLGEVCDFQGGSQPPKSEWSKEPQDGYVRMLQIRDFTQNATNYIEYVKKSKSLKYCNDDDILIGRYGASVGKILTGLSGAYNVAIIKTIPQENVNKRYLRYYFLSPYFQHNLLATSQHRAAQAGFSKEDIFDFKFLCPSLSEQQHIVDELDLLSSIIEKKKAQLKELDNLVQSLFYEMFGDPITNEKGWEIRKLADISKEKLSYGSGASAIPYDGELRYIRITDINESGELNDNIVSPNSIDEKYLLNDGDILFARSGATVGKTYYHKEKYGKCIYAGYLIRLIPNEDIVLPSYVFGYTKTQYYLEFVKSAQNAVAQPNINAKQYGNLDICIPPLYLQNQYADKVQNIEHQKELIKQSIKEVETLFNSRMDYYFN